MNYLTLSVAVQQCRACPLAFRGDGVPGEFVGVRHLGNVFGTPEVVVILEAPGGIEQEVGRPVWGESGQLFRAMMKECGVESYYVTNVVKHRPPVIKGKQQRPDAIAIKACGGFLDYELALIKPTKLILCGNVAASRILGIPGNTSQASIVNRVFTTICPSCKDEEFEVDCGTCARTGEIPVLVLYHPAYFLHNRTSVWVNKQIGDWKRALRNFMGAPMPHYVIEKVDCSVHD